MRIAFLKNLRISGADGHLFRSILKDNADWVVGSLDRSGPSTSHFDNQSTANVEISRPVSSTGSESLYQRLKQQFSVWRWMVTEKKKFPEPEFLVCGSIELAAIAQLVWPSTSKKFYLFSDITRFHANIYTRQIVRRIENYCISHGWAACVTSPGFVDGYLSSLTKQRTRVFFVQNYAPLVNWKSIDFVPDKIYSRNIILIIWCGLLRCIKSGAILKALFELNPAKYLLRVAGPITHLPEATQAWLMNTPGIDKFGQYVDHQLPEIYDGGSYTWCCDWEFSGENSRLLLPNRLYQGIAAGVPIIASKGSWMERVVNAYDIGITIPIDAKVAANLLNSISDSDYSRWKSNCRRLHKRAAAENNIWPSILDGSAKPITGLALEGQIFSDFQS